MKTRKNKQTRKHEQMLQHSGPARRASKHHLLDVTKRLGQVSRRGMSLRRFQLETWIETELLGIA